MEEGLFLSAINGLFFVRTEIVHTTKHSSQHADACKLRVAGV